MYEKQDVEALERQFNAAMEEADTGSALDAVRRIYDEFARGGEETLTALLHPKFELHMETIFLEGKSYKGVKGLMKWRGEMEELFEQERFQPEGIRFASDGRWLVLGRLHIKTPGENGVELDVPLAHVFEQRDKKVARFTAYSDIQRALDSVGLVL
jgi:ketosteroid isomerase-like protein